MKTIWSSFHKIKANIFFKRLPTIRTVPKSYRKIIERDTSDSSNTQMHVHPLSIRGTGNSIQCGGANLVYGPKGDISITIPCTDAMYI
jgi:hypothetical protein